MKDHQSGHGTAPDEYHKMVWKVDSDNPQKCMEHYKDDSRKIGSICVKQLLPTISAPQFTLDQTETLRFYMNYQQTPDSYAKVDEWGTQLPCKGDSGSGHWIYDSVNQRSSLVGMTSRNLGHGCGAPAIITDTTLPQFNNWIKKHAKIKS